MGSERSSTTRQRLIGKICCRCRSMITPPYSGRETVCPKCGPKRRVYMHYMSTANGWHCQFLEEDLKTPLRRKLRFQDPSKIEGLAIKGGADRTSEARQIMEYAMNHGRGSVWLHLTEEQYRKLN